MALAGPLENLFRREGFCVRIDCLGPSIEPRGHCRTRCQCFPAAAETARALRTGSVNHVMTDLGMRFVRTTIKLVVQNDSAADTRAHGHVNQPRLPFARAPCGFA